MADYMEKIRNLLALAERETTNEHEARSALLKARKLMAKHKITEIDLEHLSEQRIIHNMSGITYSVRRDPWMYQLAATIAENHCCRCFQVRMKGHQVAEIGFTAFEEDGIVCMEIFKYAVSCIRSKTNEMRKDKSRGVRAADGYGYGFVVGLKEAYAKQQSEEGWGLVLVVPEAVDKAMNDVTKRKVDDAARVNQLSAVAFHHGVVDGRKFEEQKRLAGET